MNSHDYQIDSTILKTNDATTLWKTESGIVEVGQNTLAVPITQDSKMKGFVLHGKCRFVLDTIVETDRGAVGKPVEKEINEPFVMLEDGEDTRQSFSNADTGDLKNMSYQDQKDFVTKAEELCEKFFGERKMRRHRHWHSDEHVGNGIVFAFPGKNNNLDLLVAKGSKIVYKAEDKTFLSNGRKVILKTPEETVIARHGRPIILKTRFC